MYSGGSQAAEMDGCIQGSSCAFSALLNSRRILKFQDCCPKFRTIWPHGASRVITRQIFGIL
jgi:hypothetical protein